MKIKVKTGEKITGKEFLHRWKSGIESVTPMQQTKITIVGYVIVVFGIIIGLYTTAILSQWWLFFILTGSIVITAVQFIGTIQKYLILKRLDEASQDG